AVARHASGCPTKRLMGAATRPRAMFNTYSTMNPTQPEQLRQAPDDAWARARAEGTARLDMALRCRNELGWSMLALCPGDHLGVGQQHRKSCSSPGKAPIGLGSLDRLRFQAIASEEEIRSWWRAYPNANVGVLLGALSKLVRIDIEGPQATQ